MDITKSWLKLLYSAGGTPFSAAELMLWLLFGSRPKADELWYSAHAAAFSPMKIYCGTSPAVCVGGTVKENLTFAGSANQAVFPGVLQPGPFLGGSVGFSTTKVGWTLGAGVETKLGGGWSA